MVAPDRRGRPPLRIDWRKSGVTLPPAGAALAAICRFGPRSFVVMMGVHLLGTPPSHGQTEETP
jgi:hypothetical protein